MAEKSRSSGLWPQMFDPLADFGTRVAEWLAPASKTTSDDNNCEITIELSGVDEQDIDLTVDKDVVSVRAKRRLAVHRKPAPGTFQIASMAPSFGHSVCPQMPMKPAARPT